MSLKDESLTKMPPLCRIHFCSAYLTDKLCIVIQISLQFVPKGLIDIKPALAGVMAIRWQTIAWTNVDYGQV